MTAWLKNENITRYSTHGEHKSAIAERFNRTLKKECGVGSPLIILEIGSIC